jgi:hypothetical protein
MKLRPSRHLGGFIQQCDQDGCKGRIHVASRKAAKQHTTCWQCKLKADPDPSAPSYEKPTPRRPPTTKLRRVK